MPEQVLFVCHANLCRSPMAEHIARRLLARWPVAVASAGTAAVPGRPMHPYAAFVTATRGGDPTGFRSRRLDAADLVEATLVLTATRRQRSFCATLAPAVLRRTFTLRQFARLAAAADPPSGGDGRPLRAVVEAAALARARLQPALDGDDLADPIGGGPADFTRCAEEIERSVAPIGALIAAAG
ncbi:low molecular weight phosphatase family protein [Micromonospora sp. WMMD882]|uniref:arsenate reductase/protein-tyrosine-phosphatase family protein n=1 Tax=Micromonospora sp. WMMD882 TaxID=3015151 RepID=UPI00248B0137|nr:low molecular weight phosphatase family protein [Micromonospora sp. WMMD882]WBB80850.1 low molecular weight phosphatase family protein [Micromonospora sp. WMMD882]